MAWDFNTDRGRPSFWCDLGLDKAAADVASKCFPESWISWYRKLRYDDWGMRQKAEELAEDQADSTARHAPVAYRTDARHPAFWFAQGHDYDEMAARAIAANAMLKLQREAAPPPPQRDRVAEVTQALLMQGAIQQRLEGPDSSDDQDYHDPQPRGPAQPQEPFNPDDYPRFQTRPS